MCWRGRVLITDNICVYPWSMINQLEEQKYANMSEIRILWKQIKLS